MEHRRRHDEQAQGQQAGRQAGRFLAVVGKRFVDGALEGRLLRWRARQRTRGSTCAPEEQGKRHPDQGSVVTDGAFQGVEVTDGEGLIAGARPIPQGRLEERGSRPVVQSAQQKVPSAPPKTPAQQPPKPRS